MDLFRNFQLIGLSSQPFVNSVVSLKPLLPDHIHATAPKTLQWLWDGVVLLAMLRLNPKTVWALTKQTACRRTLEAISSTRLRRQFVALA